MAEQENTGPTEHDRVREWFAVGAGAPEADPGALIPLVLLPALARMNEDAAFRLLLSELRKELQSRVTDYERHVELYAGGLRTENMNRWRIRKARTMIRFVDEALDSLVRWQRWEDLHSPHVVPGTVCTRTDAVSDAELGK